MSWFHMHLDAAQVKGLLLKLCVPACACISVLGCLLDKLDKQFAVSFMAAAYMQTVA